MHQLYFCYGEIEMLRGSFIELQRAKVPSATEYVQKSCFLGNRLPEIIIFFIITVFRQCYSSIRFIKIYRRIR